MESRMPWFKVPATSISDVLSDAEEEVGLEGLGQLFKFARNSTMDELHLRTNELDVKHVKTYAQVNITRANRLFDYANAIFQETLKCYSKELAQKPPKKSTKSQEKGGTFVAGNPHGYVFSSENSEKIIAVGDPKIESELQDGIAIEIGKLSISPVVAMDAFVKEKEQKKAPVKKQNTAEKHNPLYYKFWNAYPAMGGNFPKKRNMSQTAKVWNELGLDASGEAVCAALEEFKKCTDWTKDDGKFIPKIDVFLESAMWQSPPQASKAQKPTLKLGFA